MNTCGTCKHFGDRLKWLDDKDDSGEPTTKTPFHLCMLLKHLNTGYKPKVSAPAGVMDGSGYYACFCVSEEFGCNQWSEK